MVPRGGLHVGDDRRLHRLVARLDRERYAGGGKRDFPAHRILNAVELPAEPGITLKEGQAARFRHEHPVVDLGLGREKLRDRDRGIGPVGFEERGDVESGEIDPVVDPVVILVREMLFVPALEMVAEDEIELDVDVRPLAVDAITGVSHLPDRLAGGDRLSGLGGGRTEVCVE